MTGKTANILAAMAAIGAAMSHYTPSDYRDPTLEDKRSRAERRADVKAARKAAKRNRK